ncbi:MAG: efflux RND transporter permease subunit, partial [Thermodesulfovibrionales bacterium]
MQGIGISGSIAKAFIKSKLTPILVIAALLSGVFALIATPREEEPQIVVPMIDIFVTYPGAGAKEVEERVTRPMEKFLYEIKGVEYVYSIARPGMNLTIVRFYVGHDMEDAIVKVYNKLMSHYDLISPGVSQPLVKPKSIDDVPILSYTLWSDKYSSYELRRIAQELCTEIKKDSDVSETHIIGGQKRQIRLVLNPSRLRAYNLSALQIMQSIQGSNVVIPSGSMQSENKEVLVETGGFLRTAEEIGNLVIGIYNGRPVYLKNIADIVDGPAEPDSYVFTGFGPQIHKKSEGLRLKPEDSHRLYESVTIAIAKKKGTNATVIAKRIEKKIQDLRGKLIPLNLNILETRNYGETAKEKSDELLEHILIATFSVVLLIALTLGWREAVVVAVAVPVTLALTLLINYLYGYTLNRVTLFALIFSIGILVDDAIVVVENIHRHFKLHRISPLTAVLAVDEVGNPTILATFTVIAALLP